MKKLIWPALFFFLLELQGALWLILPLWPTFDLLVPCIYFVGLLYGEMTGLLTGLGAGLLQDCLVPEFFGFHMLTRCLIGYGAGLIRNRVVKDVCLLHATLIGVACAVIKLLACLISTLSTQSWSFWPSYCSEAAGFVLLNFVLAFPFFYLIKWIKNWTDEEKKIYDLTLEEEEKKLWQLNREEHQGLRTQRK